MIPPEMGADGEFLLARGRQSGRPGRGLWGGSQTELGEGAIGGVQLARSAQGQRGRHTLGIRKAAPEIALRILFLEDDHSKPRPYV